MSSNTLSGGGVSPANTKDKLLHMGTGTAGVGVVRTGDGTATVLEFVSGGAKIGGTFEVTTNLTVGGSATFSGAVTITGALNALGVPVYKRLTTDVTAATTTDVALTALDFTPVSGAVYQVEMSLIAQSVATTTGVRITNTGGAGTLVLVDPAFSAYSIAAIAGSYAQINAPVANAVFGIRLDGIFEASSTANLAFSVKSEVAASAVIIKAGSIVKITRIS